MTPDQYRAIKELIFMTVFLVLGAIGQVDPDVPQWMVYVMVALAAWSFVTFLRADWKIPRR